MATTTTTTTSSSSGIPQNTGLAMFTTFQIRTDELLQNALNYLIQTFQQVRRIFTVASPFGQVLFVLGNLSQLIFYYIEDSITELNINQASRNSSVYSLSALAGHNPTRAIAASGEIQLTPQLTILEDLPGGIVVLPRYITMICQNNNLEYTIDFGADQTNISINNTTPITAAVVEGHIEQQQYTGTGTPFASYSVSFPQNYFIDNFNFNIYVNRTLWTQYDNLLRIPMGVNGYMLRTGVTSGVDVFFGNGNFGNYPGNGDEIIMEYLVTDGFSGSIITDDISALTFQFQDVGYNTVGQTVDLNDIFNVTCTIAPDFGANPEPMDITRLMVSKSAQSLVSLDSYVTMMQKLSAFAIIRAYQDPSDTKMICLFLIQNLSRIILQGETYFTIPEDRFTLSDSMKNQILNYIEQTGTKLISTDVKIIDPIVRRFVLNISLVVYEDYDIDSINAGVINAISNYFLTTQRDTRIPRSEIIAQLTAVPGIDSVNVNIVSQQNEATYLSNPNAPLVGIDQFDDIIVASGDFPVIRGGWVDRYGNSYAEGLTPGYIGGAVNISVIDIVAETNN